MSKNSLSLAVTSDKQLLPKLGLLLLIVFIAVVLKSAIISFVMLCVLIVWDERFIIPVLLFIPAFETLLLAGQALTITKLLAVFLGAYFLLYIFTNKIKFAKNATALLVFTVIVLLGSLYGMFNLSSSATMQAAILNSFYSLLKLGFALLLYLYLKGQGERFLKESLHVSLLAIPLSLIVLLIYFIFWGSTPFMSSATIERLTLKGTDPNEFGSLVAALAAFCIYLFFFHSNKYEYGLGLFTFGLSIYAVGITVSKTAIISLIFMVLLSFSLLKSSFKRITKYALLLIFSFVLLIQLQIIDVKPIKKRFMGAEVTNLSKFTSFRSVTWRTGLEAFLDKPIIGYGNNPYTTINITKQRLGTRIVFHNTYLEILIRFGIIGFIVFGYLLFRSLKGIYRFYISEEGSMSTILLLPMIVLVVVCFTGFALSWHWKEILWYLMAISLASDHFIEN